jgi:hypothetical protein
VIARRIVDRAAGRLPGAQIGARYAEEWRADLDRVSGRPARLGFALAVLLFAAPRLRRQSLRAEHEVPGLSAACDKAIDVFESVDEPGLLEQAIVDGIVSGLGFGATTLNLVRAGGDLECVAAAGPPEMRAALLGARAKRSLINGLMARGEVWGTLRFLTDLGEADVRRGLSVWTPEGSAEAGRDAWRPNHSLIAPMYTPTGQLLGAICLDCPTSGRFPGPAQRALLEAYARRAADRLFRVRIQVKSPD